MKKNNSDRAFAWLLVFAVLVLTSLIVFAPKADASDAAMEAVDWARTAIEQSDGRPPEWVKDIPGVGRDLDAYVR